MLRKFASIAHPNTHGYAYDSEAYDSKATVNDHFRMFQTYGDGLCQHSGDWSITIEHMADYLASLAAAMLTDEELTEHLYFTIHRQPCNQDIAFAASIVYKAPKENDWNAKRRYFSVKQKKIGAGDRVKYDKRYQEITDVHDGSALSIYRVLIPEYADNMQRYAMAEAIRDWCHAETDRPYCEMSAELLKWFEKDTDQREKARALRDAFTACWNITEAHRLRAATESNLENYRRQVERQQAPANNPISEETPHATQ